MKTKDDRRETMNEKEPRMNTKKHEEQKQSKIENRKSTIICGDCLAVLPTLSPAVMIFADPPDNIGCKYEGFADEWDNRGDYLDWLNNLIWMVCDQQESPIFWFSFNRLWIFDLYPSMPALLNVDVRQFIWRYTFGQHRDSDCGSGYRPILRFMRQGAKLYPDAIRVPSARQMTYNDKRANPKGRVPDDVWEFPRVCGTFKERKAWHPCQHPKNLLRRMVLLSTRPGDLVIDLFAGSGNMIEVCRELDRDCIGIEISRFYCDKITETTGAELILNHEEHEGTRSKP
jgi:site-specific DNA-methyltransferase (adenine-specific)